MPKLRVDGAIPILPYITLLREQRKLDFCYQFQRGHVMYFYVVVTLSPSKQIPGYFVK